MSSVSFHIQRAINEAISDQIFPQIQATLRSGQGRVPERRWEVPVRGQGCRSEKTLDRSFKSNSRDEFPRFPKKRRLREHSRHKDIKFCSTLLDSCLECNNDVMYHHNKRLYHRIKVSSETTETLFEKLHLNAGIRWRFWKVS